MSTRARSVVAPKMTTISEIKCGKIELVVRARIIHLWSLPDKVNPEEAGSLHMLLLDEKCGKIHATIRKNLISMFKDDLEEGSSYVFEQFMVESNDHTFRSTDHKYKLNFMGGTKVFKVTSGNIPASHFSFVPFTEIQAATREDRLLDVIGHVAEKDVIKEIEKNGKKIKVMDITLEDLESNGIHCTLWDSYAERMQQFVDGHESSQPVIMVLQLCKLKFFYGTMGVSNAFYGTKLLLNAELPDVELYKKKLNETDAALTQVVSQMTGPSLPTISEDLIQTPRMTIEDLIEATEKCFGSVIARTCEVETDLGWFYQACTKCPSRVTLVAGSMNCDRCKKPRTVVPRFKVHVQVIDNTGSTTFILFDRVVSQVIGRNVQELLDGAANRTESVSYPAELNVLVDKLMLFKVEVNDANLYRNWRSFTVKKLTLDDEIIKGFLTFHGINDVTDGDEAKCVGGVSDMISGNPMDAIEGGDSNGKEENADASETPTSKSLGKRPIGKADGLETMSVDDGQVSATKEPKMICRKITTEK